MTIMKVLVVRCGDSDGVRAGGVKLTAAAAAAAARAARCRCEEGVRVAARFHLFVVVSDLSEGTLLTFPSQITHGVAAQVDIDSKV